MVNDEKNQGEWNQAVNTLAARAQDALSEEIAKRDGKLGEFLEECKSVSRPAWKELKQSTDLETAREIVKQFCPTPDVSVSFVVVHAGGGTSVSIKNITVNWKKFAVFAGFAVGDLIQNPSSILHVVHQAELLKSFLDLFRIDIDLLQADALLIIWHDKDKNDQYRQNADTLFDLVTKVRASNAVTRDKFDEEIKDLEKKKKCIKMVEGRYQLQEVVKTWKIPVGRSRKNK